jgi:Bacteriophage minor capsid protein
MIENDIEQQLITDGIDVSGNIFLGAIPSTPDNVIVITTSNSIMTSSLNTLPTQALIPPGISDIQQTVTITVRNTDYATGQGKTWEVYNDLVGDQSGFKVCNDRQMFIMASEPPCYSTTDDDSRILFTFNFVANTSRDT